jgi:hypothetical protein
LLLSAEVARLTTQFLREGRFGHAHSVQPADLG